MKKIGYANISEISIDDWLDVGVYTIGGIDYVLLGGAFSSKGVKNYLRPLDKAKENWGDSDYARSRKDVNFYMDNRTVTRCNSVVRDLRHDMDCQKW